MENSVKGDFNNHLRERTLIMAVKIHDIFQEKQINMLERSTVYQLIRSSTSLAANFRAATRARSDAEFYSKICIVVEECDETQKTTMKKKLQKTDAKCKIFAFRILHFAFCISFCP
jgi:four helix bundle protein